MGLFSKKQDNLKQLSEQEQILGSSKMDSLSNNLLDGLNMDIVPDELVNFLIHIHEREESINNLDWGIEFEKFLQEVFELGGYKINSSHPKDEKILENYPGIDFFAEKDNMILAVQAKRRNPQTVELHKDEEIRTFIGDIYKCEEKMGKKVKGIFITTHYFSQSAKETIQGSNIELIDKEGLMLLITKLVPELIAKAYYVKMIEGEGLLRCPVCNEVWVKKKGKYGYYWAHPEYRLPNKRGCVNTQGCDK